MKGLSVAARATNETLRQIQDWKWDEASMEERLRTGGDIQACVDCIRREYADPEEIRVVTAAMEIDGPVDIDLGGVTCRVILRDSPHSRDGLFLHIPEEKALAVGDGESGDYYELDGGYDPQKLDDLISFLEGLDYDLALPGHRAPWTKKAQLSELYSIKQKPAAP